MSAFLPPGPSIHGYGDAAETRRKLGQVREALEREHLDAVFLEHWNNVAWLTGGRGNRVTLDSDSAQCGVLVTAGGAWVLAGNNETARLTAEVFAGLSLPLVSQPWWETPLWRAALSRIPASGRWASDVAATGAVDAGALLQPLRLRLQDAEQARYRALGADAAAALESALRAADPNWTELAVAAGISAELKSRDIETAVALVGGGLRAERFRHLVPTDTAVGGGLIASITAVRHGLHASVTRCVSYGPAGQRRHERHAAVAGIDNAYLTHTAAGGSLLAAFRAGERAYAEADYYDDWKEHHQGGITGYAGREVFAHPVDDAPIEAGMTLAWNPTLPGAKSEDTVLVAGVGLELLTAAPGSSWPLLAAEGGYPRAGILEI